MRIAVALALVVAACGEDVELKLVPCTSATRAFDIEQVSKLQDAYALGADALVLMDDTAGRPAGATWRVSAVDVLVMIPERSFAAYPDDVPFTALVWDGANPKASEPWRVTQTLSKDALSWSKVTLEDPQLADDTKFRQAWWSFDFTAAIPESGMGASRYLVGVQWNQGFRQKPLIGASNFDRPCAQAWSDFADGEGWVPYDDSDGDTCNWPMLRVTVETTVQQEACE